MASSDEEGEMLPDWVTDYECFNDENQHVSFACLPRLRSKSDIVEDADVQMSLSSTCNDGLGKFYKQVIAWRYELSYAQPEILLLCKGGHWIKLLKPKRIFEATIRSVLITVHCLNFVEHNLEATVESLWCHLSKLFSTYEIPPSPTDCTNHIQLIRDAAENDKDVACSKYILGLLSQQPAKSEELHMEAFPVKRDEFIVDDALDELSEPDDMCEEEELFDTCCSICDNGGDILFCEGRCMRSFHATEASGLGACHSLGLSEAQVNAIPNFFCKNCQYQQHQCFICGKLGSSDISSDAEVFPCVSASCGRFYHPKCVALELQKRNNTQMEELEKKIAAGESFACPAHKCFVCKQVEDRKVYNLQFAVCRRCPKSYHRKCLPSEIIFEGDAKNGILQRGWDDLLPKRILMYCLDHEINPRLGTPRRNHILFPGTVKDKKCFPEKQLIGSSVVQKKRKLIPYHPTGECGVLKTAKHGGRISASFREAKSAKLVRKDICRPGSHAQRNTNKSKLGSDSRVEEKFFPKASPSSALADGKLVPGSTKLCPQKNMQSYSARPGNTDLSCKKLNTVSSTLPRIKIKCPSPVADLEMERRIIALMNDVDSSFDADEFKKRQKIPSMYQNSEDMLDKNLTLGKVEVTVEAIRTAVRTLDNGGTIDDAKTVCSPEMLSQIPFWKKKLDTYLAPFMHGMRYSSYGRHFTKLEKLQEVVDRLHCYVQDGDMIVDFCCGANDFSCLMKEKLDSVGKKCLFRNYDLFPAKNNFSFEQRDWSTVQPEELLPGSRLIMGLNPPFGYKGRLANKFINQALRFNPKLVILIVPPQTRRLDARTDGKKYDLVWEDQYLLSGKAFYLPGSVDTEDKQIGQWNKIPPPLSLWSRSDWTVKHRDIARRCHHLWLPRQPQNSQPPTWNYLMKDQQDLNGDFSNLMNQYGNFHSVPEPNYHLGGQMGRDATNGLGWEHVASVLPDLPEPNYHLGRQMTRDATNGLGWGNVASVLPNIPGPNYHLGRQMGRDATNGLGCENVASVLPNVPGPNYHLGRHMGRDATHGLGRRNLANLAPVDDLEDMDISPINSPL